MNAVSSIRALHLRLPFALGALLAITAIGVRARAGEAGSGDAGPRADADALDLDLAAEVWRAHQRRGGIVVDFGSRSRHKHTLGDWASGWRGDCEEDGRQFSEVVGSTAAVVFDAFAEEAGEGTLVVSGRAASCETAAVSLNGEEIGWVAFDDDRFSEVEIPLRGDILPGENEISIMPDEPVRTGAAGDVLLDVERMVVIPGPRRVGDPPREPGVGPMESGGAAGIIVCPGCSLTYNLVVAPGTSLEVAALPQAASETAVLEVAVRGEGSPIVAETLVEPGGASARIPLAAAGSGRDAVSVTLTAVGGEVSVARAVLRGPCAGQSEQAQAPRVTNVLVLLVDTLRADRLAAYNDRTRVDGPSLARLARSSVVFERALAPESWTKPSVASLLTGLHPDTHAVQSHSSALPRSVPVAAEVFGREGMETAAFVGNGYISEPYGFARGWSTWRTFSGVDRANSADRIADAVGRWLRKRPREVPFFAYVHMIDPHAPYAAPGRSRYRYQSWPYSGPVRPLQTANLLRDFGAGRVYVTPKDVRRLEELYDAEVSFVDHYVGRVVQSLASAGILDETLVVVTADHGEAFFERGRLGHGHSVHEELVHVPLVVRNPGASPRGRVADDVSLVDLLPTFCEVLGAACPAGVEGRSLAPFLSRPRCSSPTAVAFTSSEAAGQRAARAGRFKALYQGWAPSLFDLSEDPAESSDVRSDHPIAAAALRDALGDHLGRLAVGRGAAGGSFAHRASEAAVDPETSAQLLALGYVEE